MSTGVYDVAILSDLRYPGGTSPPRRVLPLRFAAAAHARGVRFNDLPPSAACRPVEAAESGKSWICDMSGSGVRLD